MKKLLIPCLDKLDQTPPFSLLRSKRSEAFWLIASPTSSLDRLLLPTSLARNNANSILVGNQSRLI
jgi:hypothetical protein